MTTYRWFSSYIEIFLSLTNGEVTESAELVEVPDLGSSRCPRHPVPCFSVSGRRRGVTSRNLPGKIRCWAAVGVRILYAMNGWSCWEDLQEPMVVARKYRGSMFRLTKGAMVCHTLWYPMIVIRKRWNKIRIGDVDPVDGKKQIEHLLWKKDMDQRWQSSWTGCYSQPKELKLMKLSLENQ